MTCRGGESSGYGGFFLLPGCTPPWVDPGGDGRGIGGDGSCPDGYRVLECSYDVTAHGLYCAWLYSGFPDTKEAGGCGRTFIGLTRYAPGIYDDCSVLYKDVASVAKGGY
jgi:hypothetical protein